VRVEASTARFGFGVSSCGFGRWWYLRTDGAHSLLATRPPPFCGVLIRVLLAHRGCNALHVRGGDWRGRGALGSCVRMSAPKEQCHHQRPIRLDHHQSLRDHDHDHLSDRITCQPMRTHALCGVMLFRAMMSMAWCDNPSVHAQSQTHRNISSITAPLASPQRPILLSTLHSFTWRTSLLHSFTHLFTSSHVSPTITLLLHVLTLRLWHSVRPIRA
jgi:hypothetical protein